MHAPQQFHPVHVRHVDVAEQNIDVTLLEFAQRRLTIGRSLHSITEPLKLLLQHEPKVRFVFGDQKSCITLFVHCYYPALGRMVLISCDWQCNREGRAGADSGSHVEASSMIT